MSGLQLPSLSPPPSPGFVDRQLAAEESQTARVQSYSWDVAVSTSRFEDLSQQVSEQEQVVGDIRAVQTGMARGRNACQLPNPKQWYMSVCDLIMIIYVILSIDNILHFITANNQENFFF